MHAHKKMRLTQKKHALRNPGQDIWANNISEQLVWEKSTYLYISGKHDIVHLHEKKKKNKQSIT